MPGLRTWVSDPSLHSGGIAEFWYTEFNTFVKSSKNWGLSDSFLKTAVGIGKGPPEDDGDISVIACSTSVAVKRSSSTGIAGGQLRSSNRAVELLVASFL